MTVGATELGVRGLVRKKKKESKVGFHILNVMVVPVTKIKKIMDI